MTRDFAAAQGWKAIKQLQKIERKVANVPTMSVQAERKSKAFWVAEIPPCLQRGYVAFVGLESVTTSETLACVYSFFLRDNYSFLQLLSYGKILAKARFISVKFSLCKITIISIHFTQSIIIKRDGMVSITNTCGNNKSKLKFLKDVFEGEF